jgi:hypothetical protein
VEEPAFTPDYGFRVQEGEEASEAAGTAVAGITGRIITLLLAGGIGFIIHAVRKKKALA